MPGTEPQTGQVFIQGIIDGQHCNNCDSGEINKWHTVYKTTATGTCIWLWSVEGTVPGYTVQVMIGNDGDQQGVDYDFCPLGWDWFIRVDLHFHIDAGCRGIPEIGGWRSNPDVSWRRCFSGPLDCSNIDLLIPFLTDDSAEGGCDGSGSTCRVVF